MKKKNIDKLTRDIRRDVAKVSKQIEAEDTVWLRIEDREKKVYKEDYVKAKTKQMVEFGYGGLKEADVEKQLELLLAGKTTMDEGLTIIGMFMKGEVVVPEKDDVK